MLRWGSGLLLATTLFVGACGPTKTPAPTPAPKQQVIIDGDCNGLPVTGFYYHAYQKDGSAPGGFAPWEPVKDDPTRAVAVATVPIGTVAIGIDIGCGGTPKNWGINSHQDPVRLGAFSMFAVNCNFVQSDLPQPGMGTENVANACTVTPQIPATAGNQ